MATQLLVNGKHYPLWSQFVDKSDEFKGGILEDLDMGMSMKTVIDHIELRPNGTDSAFFEVVGKDFGCGFDVSVGGISGRGEPGWLTFSGYGGHTWRIKKPQAVTK